MEPDITSSRNPRVKDAAALSRRKERDQQRRYLLEGPRFVRDAIAATPGAIAEVFVTADAVEHVQAAFAEVTVTVVTEPVMERLAKTETPQGVVAVAEQRRSELAEVIGRGTLVLLCDISDPGNAGTIVRTATAAGATGVVFTAGSVDPWHPKAVRAAAGTTTRMPFVVDADPITVIESCQRTGQTTVALDAGASTTVFDDRTLRPPVTLCLGAEADGLSEAVTTSADTAVAIPCVGPVESLNLAAAAAVALYAPVCVDGRRGVGRAPDGGG